MIVKILLFAEARDLVGADFVELEHGDSTTKEKLLAALGEKFSQLAEILPTCDLAYNHVSFGECCLQSIAIIINFENNDYNGLFREYGFSYEIQNNFI